MTKSEIALKENVVWLDKSQLVHIVFRGDQPRKKIRDTIDQIKQICKQLQSQHHPILMLADIRDIGKYPPESRIVGMKARTELPFWRMAIITGKDDINQAISVSHKLSETSILRKEISYFTSIPEANKWLNQLRSATDILNFFKPIL
jgi:hypothetical protein